VEELHEARQLRLAALRLDDVDRVVVRVGVELHEDLPHQADTGLAGDVAARQGGELSDHLSQQAPVAQPSAPGGAAPLVLEELPDDRVPAPQKPVGGALLGLVGAHAQQTGVEGVADDDALDDLERQSRGDLEPGVLLKTLHGDREDGDLGVSGVAQALAEHGGVVGGAAHAAGLGDGHDAAVGVVGAVLEGADELTVTLNDNREFSARVVGTDKSTDLALIKVNAKNLPTLPIGNSDNLKVGEWVIAVGNPYNLNSTVTAGIVSAKARGLGATQGVESFIQTDAAINQGNSGGALVNVQGELVGINAMLYSQTGAYSGYGFAIPTAIMNKVVEDIKKYGSVQRVMLGIQGGDVLNYINAQKEEGKSVDLGTNEGVFVDKVSEDGNGAEIGLRSKDVITKFDGKKVTKMSELQQLLNVKRPGDKATITFMRDKKEITKTVVLKNAQGTTKPIAQADIDVLGGQFRPVTEALQKQ